MNQKLIEEIIKKEQEAQRQIEELKNELKKEKENFILNEITKFEKKKTTLEQEHQNNLKELNSNLEKKHKKIEKENQKKNSEFYNITQNEKTKLINTIVKEL
jgi:vacuolar-type H+-ATPase subunit H